MASSQYYDPQQTKKLILSFRTLLVALLRHQVKEAVALVMNVISNGKISNDIYANYTYKIAQGRLTCVPVNAVHSLYVAGHSVDTCLLSPEAPVEQMVRLKVE